MIIRQVLLGLCALLLVACGGSQPAATPGDASITASAAPASAADSTAGDPAITELIDELERRGITALREGPSQIAWLSSVPGHAYRLNEGNLFIHAYPSAEAAQQIAAQIPPTADNGRTDWAGQPHFFRCDRVIALYLGQAPAVTDALTARCGPRFAGQ